MQSVSSSSKVLHVVFGPWAAADAGEGAAQNMVGRAPLIPCFLAGNPTPTIPHMFRQFSKRRDSGFPFGCADSAAADGRRGNNVYEVNLWLWQFGRAVTASSAWVVCRSNRLWQGRGLSSRHGTRRQRRRHRKATQA